MEKMPALMADLTSLPVWGAWVEMKRKVRLAGFANVAPRVGSVG